MPRPLRVDQFAIAQLAPLRVASVATLAQLGLSSASISRRVSAGTWQRPFPGVVLMQSGPPTREQEIEAARLYAGDGAVLTGIEAARRHGLRHLPGDDMRLQFLVAEDRQRKSVGLAEIERTERLPRPVERGGVSVAPHDRAVTDAARSLSSRGDVLAVIAEAVQRRRTTVLRLRRELNAGCQRGTSLPRDVLNEVDDGVRSVSEGWAYHLHAGSDLPAALWNPRVLRADGRLLGSPDALFDKVCLAWELDSVMCHPEGEDETARRRADFVAEGILVVHHRPRRLLTEPRRVVEELWHYYRLAESRPRPDIRVLPSPAGSPGARQPLEALDDREADAS